MDFNVFEGSLPKELVVEIIHQLDDPSRYTFSILSNWCRAQLIAESEFLTDELIEEYASNGYKSYFEWMISYFGWWSHPPTLLPKIIKGAFAGNQLELVEWAIRIPHKLKNYKIGMSTLASYGRKGARSTLPRYESIVKFCGLEWKVLVGDVFAEACSSGNVVLAEYLLESFEITMISLMNGFQSVCRQQKVALANKIFDSLQPLLPCRNDQNSAQSRISASIVAYSFYSHDEALIRKCLKFSGLDMTSEIFNEAICSGCPLSILEAISGGDILKYATKESLGVAAFGNSREVFMHLLPRFPIQVAEQKNISGKAILGINREIIQCLRDLEWDLTIDFAMRSNVLSYGAMQTFGAIQTFEAAVFIFKEFGILDRWMVAHLFPFSLTQIKILLSLGLSENHDIMKITSARSGVLSLMKTVSEYSNWDLICHTNLGNLVAMRHIMSTPSFNVNIGMGSFLNLFSNNGEYRVGVFLKHLNPSSRLAFQIVKQAHLMSPDQLKLCLQYPLVLDFTKNGYRSLWKRSIFIRRSKAIQKLRDLFEVLMSANIRVDIYREDWTLFLKWIYARFGGEMGNRMDKCGQWLEIS